VPLLAAVPAMVCYPVKQPITTNFMETVSFQDITTALVATAKDEGLTVSYLPDGSPAIHRNDGVSLGIIAAVNYDISFYFKDSYGKLNIRSSKSLDEALSIGLDFIYV
jgi:hypothetical protein